MKKILTLTALAALATSAHAQNYIAGLDFKNTPDLTNDISFDHGPEKGLFTLNIQSPLLAEDNDPTDGVTDPGWAAPTDPVPEVPGAQFGPFSLNTLDLTAGATASTSLFGGTSAYAQGFSDTWGLVFKTNDDGFFTISLNQAVDNLVLAFDVAALVSEGQSVGTLAVNGNNLSVTDAFSNQSLSLGNLAAGEITFDLAGLDGGATFDNFMISGTVSAVPEPSTYAAIFGAAALAFVASRRRRA